MVSMWTGTVIILALLLAINRIVEGSSTTSSTQIPDGVIKNESIYFLVLVPFPNSLDPPAFNGGHSLIPAVLLAMDHINAHRDILPNHILKPIIADSACEKISRTALSFPPNIFHRSRTKHGISTPLAVVGPACSESSLYIAKLTKGHPFKILHAVSGTTPALDEHSKFPNTFGMVSSSRAMVELVVDLAKCNSWKKVSIFYDASRFFFTEALEVMIKRFADEKIKISYTGAILSTILLTRASYEEQGTRIIIILASAKLSRKLACMGEALGFTYPEYQLFFLNRGLGDFYQSDSFLIKHVEDGKVRNYNCSQENIMRGINGSILFYYSLGQSKLKVVSGYSVENIKYQYEQKVQRQCLRLSEDIFIYPYINSEGEVKEISYNQKLKEYCSFNNQTIKNNNFAYPYYDATWALAMSLDKALTTLNGNLSKFNILFSAEGPNQMRKEMYNLTFQGVSTYINFDRDTGHVTSYIDTIRVSNNTSVLISNSGYNKSFKCTEKISDMFPLQYEKLDYYSVVIGGFLTATSLLITLVLHILNIIYRKRCSIKASSPLLNHFIFFGCYSAIASTILKTFESSILSDNESHVVVACNLSYYGVNLSFDLIFGTVCFKLWRLYCIFNRTFKKQKNMSNNIMIVYIILLTLLDAIFHLWMIQYHLKSEVMYKYVIKSKNGQIQLIGIMCNFIFGYVLIPLVFHVTLMLVVLILCILNRNIKLKDFRSTRSVIATTYGLVLLWSSGVTLVVIFIQNRNAVYLLYTVLLTGTVFLCQVVLILPVTFLALTGQKKEGQKKERTKFH